MARKNGRRLSELGANFVEGALACLLIAVVAIPSLQAPHQGVEQVTSDPRLAKALGGGSTTTGEDPFGHGPTPTPTPRPGGPPHVTDCPSCSPPS